MLYAQVCKISLLENKTFPIHKKVIKVRLLFAVLYGSSNVRIPYIIRYVHPYF